MSDDTQVLEAEAEAETETEEAEQTPETIESLATTLGWAPQERWQGDGEWKDAATFLHDMIDGRQALKKTLKRQDTELSEVRRTLDEFKEHYRRAEDLAYKRAKADLETQFGQAVTKGDAAAAGRIREQIEGLEEPKPNGQDPDPNQDPHFIAWHADNQWYGPDVRRTEYAERIAPYVQRKGLTGRAHYDEISKLVAEEFDKPPPRRRQNVESAGGTAQRKSNGKSYADLPPEAKAACDRFVTQGVFLGSDKKPLPVEQARAEYCKTYDWD